MILRLIFLFGNMSFYDTTVLRANTQTDVNDSTLALQVGHCDQSLNLESVSGIIYIPSLRILIYGIKNMSSNLSIMQARKPQE